LQGIDINKIKAGDQTAFKTFFVFFYPKLLALACRFVDKHIALDLVQDVFTLYWEQKEKIEALNIQSFLYKCVQNKCLNHLKHEQVENQFEARMQIAEARVAYMNDHLYNNDTWKQLVDNDLKEVVESSLQKLPPRCAEAFRLSFFYDLPHKKVAQMMGISHRTVETHIRQAVIFLRTDLHHLLILLFYLKS